MVVSRKDLAHLSENLQLVLSQSSEDDETVEISREQFSKVQSYYEQIAGHQFLRISDVYTQYNCNLNQPNDESPFEKLKKRLSNTTSLLICDPYFFARDTRTTNFIKLLPKSIKQIRVIHSDSSYCFCKNTADKIREKLPVGISMSRLINEDIHDRVWIKDQRSGFVVGTSLNGIGKKITFILDIPTEDLEKFLSMIDPIIQSGWIGL